MRNRAKRLAEVSRAIKQDPANGNPLTISWRSIDDPEIEPKPGDTRITWEPDGRIVSRRYNLDGTITER